MHGDSTFHEALSDLFDGGWIDEVLYEVRSGKEATVFCCRAGARSLERLSEFSTPHSTAPRLSADILLAAKVYRDLESRRFKNDAIYQTGRVHLAREGRVKRAADNKSHFGRQVQYGMWIEHEWETLRVLHEAGLPVPAPIARGERAILMTYLGDADGPAPALAEIDLPRDQAWDTFDHLLDAVFAMLSLDRVHGDLSAYNILWWPTGGAESAKGAGGAGERGRAVRAGEVDPRSERGRSVRAGEVDPRSERGRSGRAGEVGAGKTKAGISEQLPLPPGEGRGEGVPRPETTLMRHSIDARQDCSEVPLAHRATIIDFPQAIDPRLNPAARTLLARDVANLCRWAAKQGVPAAACDGAAAERITRTMWGRF
ncbi:MAG: hypothetical protein KJZ68_16205, partial [Phycisphaerales bacterium]|nr:hypothetical protein [Phycisphaerales bacterium]